MSEHSGAPAGFIRQALLDYQPNAGAYDEVLDGGGTPRPRWAPLLDQPVVRPGAGGMHAARPWQLDILPYIADADEWRVVERGLVQRARLLNAMVADFYGPQNLPRQHGLPPALLFANPGYLPQCRGCQAPGGNFLNLLAFDLGRSPDGNWRVLANRTDAPVGLGLALENRTSTARALPHALEGAGIAGIAGFFDELAHPLREPESTIQHGLSVILCGGAHQAAYPDRAGLGRHLGIGVVEGSDLTVGETGVYLKTPEGPKPVQTILRAVDSLVSDPLEIATTSLHGTPGLLACAARGQVQVINAIGSAVVENPAISGFLPGLCRTLFDEALILPDLATWWCGQPREAGHVAGHLDTLVLCRAFEPAPCADKDFLAGLLREPAAVDAESFHRNLAQRPYDYAGREPMLLSTMPYREGENRLRPAPFTLRLFVAATREGYRLMPGGLARVATPGGVLSKDVWVPGSQAPPRPGGTSAGSATRGGPSAHPDGTCFEHPPAPGAGGR